MDTLAIPMDDFGRTELTEEFRKRCFDFIAAGLEDTIDFEHDPNRLCGTGCKDHLKQVRSTCFNMLSEFD